jgi:hypothetical protein
MTRIVWSWCDFINYDVVIFQFEIVLQLVIQHAQKQPRFLSAINSAFF